MQVFSERISSAHGGRPLPLAQYLGCHESIDPFAVRLNGRSYRSALQDESGFPVVNALLLGGVNVDAQDGKTGDTALHIAVRCTRTDTQESDGNNNDNDKDVCMDEGADEKKEKFGLLCRNARIISFLLDNGADANARNLAGETVLMHAAAAANTRAVQILLAHGADVSLRDTVGRCALSYAAGFPHVLQAMSVSVEDIAVRCAKENLLHDVCRRQCSVSAALFLIEQFGLDVNAREGEGLNDKEILTNIESKESDGLGVRAVNGANAHTNEPTQTQASERAMEGATVVSVRSGLTPLHCAILSGSESLVRALLMKGADINCTDAFGVSPLQLAATRSSRPTRVLRLLRAFDFAETDEKREKFLKDSLITAASLRELNTPVDVLFFFAAAFLPHVALLIFAALAPASDWLLVAAATIIMFMCTSALLQDDQRRNARPLRGIGFFVGYLIAICGTAWSYLDPFLDATPRLFCAAAACLLVLCVCLVVFRNPGVVELSTAQRAALHRAVFLRIRNIRTEEDARRALDERRMLCRPLRAQHCPQLNCAVLRYDHYCAWLSSAIGARNHKAYIGVLAVSSVLFAGLYLCVPTTLEGTRYTARGRCAALYITCTLPLALLFTLLLFLQHLRNISRGITSYDATFPSRCPWCFTLGHRVYSLYDVGAMANMRRFFLCEENLTAQTHRMPVINARLQGIARRHQKMQCMSCESDHNHSHNGHDHSHNGHDHSHNDHNHSHNDPNHSHNNPNQFQDVFNHLQNDPNQSPISPASVSGAEGAAAQLFQLMVQNGDAAIAALPAAENIRTELSEAQWKDAESKAAAMFSFFQESLTGAGST